VYDGATPSGNAVMADNLYSLSVFFDIPGWRERAIKMISAIANIAEKYPTSFGYWCLNMQGLIVGIKEIAILGRNYNQIATEILREYTPLKLLQCAPSETDAWPLLKNKSVSAGKTKIYVCENYSCLQPVETFQEFKSYYHPKNIFNKKSTEIK
jgi:uncharacterized protein YyaL (SSP411 family)